MFKDTHAFYKTCENCQKVDIGKKVFLVNDNVFKVNENRLKAYFDNFLSVNESIGLNDPIYKG